MRNMKSTLNSYSQEIIEALKFSDIAIFCGAGISRNSGLPLADELKREILSNLFDNEQEIEEIMESKQPFEIFMETLVKHAGFDFLDIFRKGKPNRNHLLVADLAKKRLP